MIVPRLQRYSVWIWSGWIGGEDGDGGGSGGGDGGGEGGGEGGGGEGGMDGGGEHVTTYAVRGWPLAPLGLVVSDACSRNQMFVRVGSPMNVIVWQEASPLFRFAANATAAFASVLYVDVSLQVPVPCESAIGPTSGQSKPTSFPS